MRIEHPPLAIAGVDGGRREEEADEEEDARRRRPRPRLPPAVGAVAKEAAAGGRPEEMETAVEGERLLHQARRHHQACLFCECFIFYLFF